MLQRGVFSLGGGLSRALRVEDGPLKTHRVPGGHRTLLPSFSILPRVAQGFGGASDVSPLLSPGQGPVV